jgi:hypothetical protein
MIVLLILAGFVFLAIEPSFSLPMFVVAAMFWFWALHDRSKMRQNKL